MYLPTYLLKQLYIARVGARSGEKFPDSDLAKNVRIRNPGTEARERHKDDQDVP